MSQTDKIILDNKIRLYVPSTYDVDKSIGSNASIENMVAKRFAKWFGGSSAYPIRGFWVSDNGSLVSENVSIVESLADCVSFEESKGQVTALAKALKRYMKQESILIEFNGIGELV